MSNENRQDGMKNVFYNTYSQRKTPAETGSALSLLCLPPLTLIFAALLCFLATLEAGQNDAILNLSDPNVRQKLVERLASESQQKKAAAWEIAKSEGWTPKEQINDIMFELMAIENGRLYVYKTCNVNAAISIAADLIRNTEPYYLNGAGLTVGIWDAGAVRPTHQEFGGRVTVRESVDNHNHSTHVAGTIAAAGTNPDALGMAPSVLVDSYEWNDDVSEMTSRAMSYPNEPDKIQVSNHSYSYICGWETGSFSGNYGPHWFGTWGDRESDYFGIYSSEVAQWDQLCYNAPYYLPFKAAGNDRSGSNNKAPPEGTTFWYQKRVGPFFVQWRSKQYDPSKDPYDDSWDNGGFDTIPIIGVAQYIVTIGAVSDAVTAGARDVSKAMMTSFSVWGPTDDGRIKPDIVTNGVGIYSPVAGSDSSYASYSGTSMASPGAAGAAMLLVDYYAWLFPAHAMRASTLKALIIHTADDLGNDGPDYKFGWGLLNAKAAADLLADHYDSPDANMIVEGALDDVNTVANYTFEWGTAGPIKATLCWTDPPATGLTVLDDPSPRLINDLDLRIIDPNGSTTYYPYVLNPAGPNDTATTADNTLDNVEQVVIYSPNVPGTYTVQISYKGTLTNSQQYYSLIVSGCLLADFNGDGFVDFKDLRILAGYWLQSDLSVDIAQSGGDGIINFLDFAKFAESFN